MCWLQNGDRPKVTPHKIVHWKRERRHGSAPLRAQTQTLCVMINFHAETIIASSQQPNGTKRFIKFNILRTNTFIFSLFFSGIIVTSALIKAYQSFISIHKWIWMRYGIWSANQNANDRDVDAVVNTFGLITTQAQFIRERRKKKANNNEDTTYPSPTTTHLIACILLFEFCSCFVFPLPIFRFSGSLSPSVDLSLSPPLLFGYLSRRLIPKFLCVRVQLRFACASSYCRYLLIHKFVHCIIWQLNDLSQLILLSENDINDNCSGTQTLRNRKLFNIPIDSRRYL